MLMKKKLSFMMVALFAIASFAVQYSHSIEDAPASLGLTTVAELTALADKAEFTYAAPLEIQAMPKKGSNVYCYVKDDTGWTLIYDAGGSKTAGLEVGKKIAANWDGSVSIYNGLFEAVPAAALTATEDPAVTPTFETVPVTAVTAENVNKIVKLEGVTVAAVNGNNFKVKSGELSVAGYNQFAVEGLANGAVVNMTGAIGIYNTTVQFQPIEVEVVTPAPAPAPIEISPASGADITAALEEATAVQTPTSITINLAANGAYTISAPIVPSAAFTINGNGATIDASGLTDAFIKMSKQPSVEMVVSGQYVVAAESKIDNVKITGLTKSLFADNGMAYAFETFTISNSVFQFATQGSVVLNFANAMAINFNITGSTFYSTTAGTANFIALSGKRPWQITGYEDVDGKLTVDHNTFYNVAKAKQFLNTNTLKGQNKYKYEMNSNIFVDVSNKKIYGNMTNNTNQVITDSKNTYLFEGVFFAETNYNGDEGLQTDPGFKDAANGDFTLALTSDQNTAKTGDPRWISYSINVADGIENGTVVPDVTSAAAGTVVTLTATPAEGYELDAITVTGVTTEIAVTVTDGKFTMPADAVTVNATFKKAPADVTVDASDITDGDITAAIAAKAAGAPVKNLTINLAADGAYTVSAPIEATGSVVINGAAGAKIDASTLTGDNAVIKLPAGVTDLTNFGQIAINNVNMKIATRLVYANKSKFWIEKIAVDNCVISVDGTFKKSIFDCNSGGNVKLLSVNNSTIYADPKIGQNGGFFSSQSSQKPTEFGDKETQTFQITNSTLYNITNGNNMVTLRENNKSYLNFIFKNNVIVNCGKNKEFFKGFGSGNLCASSTWDVDGNIVNFSGVDTSADDLCGGEIKNPIKGVVAFTDAANGDFNGNVALSWGAEQPAAQPGDPRWALTYSQKGIMEDGKYFIMGLSYDNPQQWLAGGKLSDFGMEFTATFDATALTYTLQNAEGKYLQSDLTFGETAFGWTVDNDAVYGQNIYMKDGDTKKYIGVNEEKNLVLTETATDPTIGWGFFSADYFWAAMAPRVIVGSTELTGTAEAGIADIKNAMTLNELTGLWEKTIKLVEITAEKQPNFQVALNGDAAKAYPAEPRAITLADFGAEAQPGFYNITITYNDEGNVVGVSGVKVEPTDIVITPADLGADYGVINETLEKALDGKLPKSITINLGEGINYFVTKSITTAAPLTINGATGATIDASALTGDFITLNGTTEMVEKPDHTYDASHHYIANVTVKDVKILGLKGSFIKDAQKTLLEKLDVENAVIEMAANKQVINFQSKGYVGEVVFKNSTLYSSLDKHEQFFAQYGSRPKNIEGSWLQQFDIEGCTFYNIAVGKNVCDFPMNSQTTNVYTLKNNIFVNVGKSGQTVVGFNKGGVSANPAWTVDANVFNYDGADKSADEVAKAGKKAEEDIVKNSIAGVITFTDAANGDFNGKIKLAPGTVAPATLPGDARWTLTTEATKLYIIGDMNSWNRTAMTEMTFNTETQAFEYEYAPTTTAYFAFADYQMTEDEAAADIDWSIFNTYRYAIGENDQNVTLNAPVALLKVNGTIVLQPVKDETSYKISVAADFSTVTVAGEAKPILPYVVAGSSAELFGTAWDAAAEANAMTLNETTGNYEITYSNVTLSAGNIEYKVVKDGSTWLPESGNLILNIAEAGSYNVTFTINPNTNEITGVATSTTGINAVKADALKDAQIYTISGQRVDKAQKGLYIVNGRKVVVK